MAAFNSVLQVLKTVWKTEKQRRVRGPSSNLTLTVARNFPFRRSSRGTERGKGRKIKKVPKLDVNPHLDTSICLDPVVHDNIPVLTGEDLQEEEGGLEQASG